MAQGIERRASARVRYPLRVSGVADYRVFEARVENLSLSGAHLYSPVQFLPGNSLGLIVKLPGTRRFFVIPAEVVWSQHSKAESEPYRYRLGIKYLYLLPDLEEKFRAFFRVVK